MGWWERLRRLAGAARARWRPVPADLEPALLAVQKDATADSAWIWIGAYLDLPDATDVTATVRAVDRRATGADAELVWWSFEDEAVGIRGDSERRFFHGHVEVTGLVERVTTFEVAVDGAEVAPVRLAVRRLPTAVSNDGDDSGAFTLFAASCYDADTDRRDRLGAAHDAASESGRRPDAALLLGDQVYLDAPFWRTIGRLNKIPRATYLTKYWRTWGGPDRSGSRRGLAPVLADGPNYFLPDDHEFWNNWPHRTVLARHSSLNLREAARKARLRQALREGPAPTRAGARLRAWQENHQPVAYDEWDRWSAGAFELFESFQTRHPDRSALSRGEREDRDDPTIRNGPFNHLFQSFTVDPVTVALLDTRTRRVRRHDTEGATFVDDDTLDAMLATAASAPVFVLCLAQPLLAASKYPADAPHGGFPLDESNSLDRGIHDYWAQYERLVAGLIAARDGRPTIVVGGDIHRSYVGFAPELSLVEVVASPMSFVAWGRAFRWRSHLRRLPLIGAIVPGGHRAGERYGSYEEILRGPAGLVPAPPEGGPRYLATIDDLRNGFATLSFTPGPGGKVDLAVTLFDRDATAAGDAAAAQTIRFRLDPEADRSAAIEHLA